MDLRKPGPIIAAMALLGAWAEGPSRATEPPPKTVVCFCRRCKKPVRPANVPNLPRYCACPSSGPGSGPWVAPAVPPASAGLLAQAPSAQLPPLPEGPLAVPPSPGVIPPSPGAAGVPPSGAPEGGPAPVGPAPAPGTPAAPPPLTAAPPSDFTPSPALTAGQGGGLGGESGALNPHMIGDQGPGVVIQQLPGGLPAPPGNPPGVPNPPATNGQRTVAVPGGTQASSVALPFIRTIKIAENQSPRPVDRVYGTFNYYDNVNGRINREVGDIVRDLRVYRQIYGFEKTFLDQRASIGVRIPILTATSNSFVPGFGGTSTAFGDLEVILKYMLYFNPKNGNVFSTGMVVAPPTGTHNFAGANYLRGLHVTQLQPYVGYILNRGRFYFQGFTAIQVPTNSADATLLYNDVGVGFYAYRNYAKGTFLTDVIPTFETHVNTPLNHSTFRVNDPGSTYNVVDLTLGLNFVFWKRALLTVGVVDPVTGPKPFSLEGLVQFAVRF